MKLWFTVSLLWLGISLQAQLDFSQVNEWEHPLLDSLEHKVAQGDYEQLTSVLVAQGGQLLYEKYFNGNDQSSRHNCRSVTKTIASLLVGVAIDQSAISSVSDPLTRYLEPRQPVRNPDPRKESITIEDLLTMSSCLECDDGNYYSRGNEERMYIIEDWTQFMLDLPVRSYPWGPKPEEAPFGRVFTYCTAGAAALAEVVSEAVGQPAAELLSERILKPLDITDYELHYSPRGELNTAGGSEYRSRDFIRLIQLCLQEGRWGDQQIISADYLAAATSPKVQARENVNYGYLFWLPTYGPEGEQYAAFAMFGNGGNKVVAIPELELSVVITATNYGNRRAHGYSDEILNEFIIPALKE